MGGFVTAGALQGLGQGIQSEVANTRRLEQRDFDAAREQKLRELEMKFRTSEREAGQEFQSSERNKGFEQQTRLEGQKASSSMNIEKSKETQQEAENALERENRLAIQRLKNEGTADNKTTKSRYQFGRTPASSGIDPKTGALTTTPAQVMLSDTSNGQTFIQAGREIMGPDPADPTGKTQKVIGFENNFYPPNVDPKNTRRATPEAIQALVKRPQLSDFFLQKYGYLPGAFIQAQQAMIKTSSSSRNKAPAAQDDDDE